MYNQNNRGNPKIKIREINKLLYLVKFIENINYHKHLLGVLWDRSENESLMYISWSNTSVHIRKKYENI